MRPVPPRERRRLSVTSATCALIASLFAAHASLAADEERSFEIYGFAMTDFIHDFQRVDPDWDDAFRPSRIPTTEGEFGGDGQSSISVKQSRFGVKGRLPIDFKFKFDLFGTGADAGDTAHRRAGLL